MWKRVTRDICFAFILFVEVSGLSTEKPLTIKDFRLYNFVISFPGETDIDIITEDKLYNFESINLEFFASNDIPDDIQVMAYLQDWEYWWYQILLPGYVRSGTSQFEININPENINWKPVGHQGCFHYRLLIAPRKFGIRLFSKKEYKGVIGIKIKELKRYPDIRSSPYIYMIDISSNTVHCYEKFEVKFRLPDRYLNPFKYDDELSVKAEISIPDGKSEVIDCFYTQDFYIEKTSSKPLLYPQSKPYWCMRYSPRVTGKYTVILKVVDKWGSSYSPDIEFNALPQRKHGFICVSGKDRRYFEFSDGTPFFPIGHNIRSPFDTRFDTHFPWRSRLDQGSIVYEKYFKKMSEAGENFCEIWSAPWSFGLEWSDKWYGYHGLGEYNMLHAWEFDRVLELADNYDIFINLVIHNHGKFSTFSDKEWFDNPFYTKNGGYLENPEEYFTDQRAIKSFCNQMRYMIARWGYSRNIFAWELWSELDLTGTKREWYRSNEVVEWHRLMGRVIKDMDPYDHLITTHYCGDYSHQYPPITELPEIDHCSVDAYHNNPDPLYIIDLIRQTAEYNNPYKKPVVITEYGGSSRGEDIRHIRVTMHVANWASVCSGIGGVPLLWWWQLIDEEDLYHLYTSVARFMEEEDKRDPEMQPYIPDFIKKNYDIGSMCLKSSRKVLAWFYVKEASFFIHRYNEVCLTDLKVKFKDMVSGKYKVQFWDTVKGEIFSEIEVESEKEDLIINIPPFSCDIAIKIKLIEKLKGKTGEY